MLCLAFNKGDRVGRIVDWIGGGTYAKKNETRKQNRPHNFKEDVNYCNKLILCKLRKHIILKLFYRSITVSTIIT